MKAVLDSNFIITCVKQKIDFFEDLEFKGVEIIIPKEVIREVENLKIPEAKLALKIIEKNPFEEIEIGKGHVDKRIIDYAKENPETAIATLDKEILDKIANHKIIIRERKKLEIQ